MTTQEIKLRLENGDKIILVSTTKNGYTDYYRFLSDGETAPCKGLRAITGGYFFDALNIIEIPKEIAVMNSKDDFYDVKDVIKKYLETLKTDLSDELHTVVGGVTKATRNE